MVALNPANGEVLWKAAVPKADARRLLVADCRRDCGPAAVHPVREAAVSLASAHRTVRSSGATMRRQTASRTARRRFTTTAIVFAASNYGVGGGLVEVTKSGEKFEAKQVYFTNKMQNHHGGMVLVDGYLYGDGGGSLRCIDFKTGKIAWEEADRARGRSRMPTDDSTSATKERAACG